MIAARPLLHLLSACVWLMVSKWVFAPATLHAQTLRGVTLDAVDTPVSGVVLVLLDSTGTERTRSLSNYAGQFSIRAPFSGTFRIQALQIGYLPTTTAPMMVAGDAGNVRVVLDGARVTLAAVKIVDKSACGRQSSSNANMVFEVWDQAMTSISAAALASSARGMIATIMTVERKLDPDAKRVRAVSASIRTANVVRPWRSLSEQELRSGGYSTVDRDGFITYNAPDLDILVSPAFIVDHCLRLIESRDTSEIGVRFEPNSRRKGKSDIKGTIWLTRNSSVLRRMDFTYTNVPESPPVAEGVAGGDMQFNTIGDGSILISHWEIRMPILERQSPRSPVKLAQQLTSGGELILVRRGADTLFKGTPIDVDGDLLDSLSGKPLTGASVSLSAGTPVATTDVNGRFKLQRVLPGEYSIDIRTPGLDSIRSSSRFKVSVVSGMPTLSFRVPAAAQVISSLCGRREMGVGRQSRGAIVGTVHTLADSGAVAGIRVVGDWMDASAAVSGDPDRGDVNRRVETRTDSAGTFRLCGVPVSTQLSVRALPDSGRSETRSVVLGSDQRFASTSFSVDYTRQAVATFRGVVQSDSTFRPVVGAEVLLPEYSLSTRTDANGAFVLFGVPPGANKVTVRQIGYSSLSTTLSFESNDEQSRRLILFPLNVLDSVVVLATRADRALLEFEENRKIGLGHFLTRADLAKLESLSMASALAMVPSLGLARGRNNAYIMSTHYVIPLSGASECSRTEATRGSSLYVPNMTERLQGIVCGCYAQVYIDGSLVNGGKPTEPFNVNSIPPAQIEAIEWYSGTAQTPMRYATLNSNCGVYIIHSRRPDERSKLNDNFSG